MNQQKQYEFLLAGVCLLVLLFPLSILADTGDGTVLSVTKIQDNGPDAQRFNIVIMGDGYQSHDIATFETQVQQVVNAFNANVSFGHCGGAVNFYRVNIASNESGADKPCATPPITRATYLDSSYCNGVRRCIWSSNILLVQSTADSATVYWSFIVVLVNDTEHGGCASSNITFSSTGTNFTSIVLHELGHAVGGLGDEYEYGASDTYTGSEPSRPNLTIQTNRADVKWYDLILATTPIPTWNRSDCTNAALQPPASWEGIIGTYEGGSYHRCGIYRPVRTCLMRVLGVNFCSVCRRRIQQVLLPHFSTSNLSITPWGYFLSPPSHPYWQTPDVWCDNNGNGIQEPDEPSIGKSDNHLFARITNTGNVSSGSFQVRFSYVPFTGVIDLANEQHIHTASRPPLGAGLTDEVEVLWDLTSVPPAFAGINHFCVIVEIISDECATYDNKAQNNFNSVPTVGPTPAPVSFYIKNILDVDAVGAIIIEPRPASWQFTANVPDLKNIPLRPKEEKLITIDCKYLETCKDREDIVTDDVRRQSRICAKGNFDFSFKLNGQILGGVSSEIIVHTPQRRWCLSLHIGRTYPIRNFRNLYDGGLMVGLDVGYRLKPQLSLVGLVGYNKFTSAVSSVTDTYWW
ncbi:MAG: hypothetical protein GTO45_29265, partial [Candidatus Aminicenantes bacterium]|nr:hypothetical protein [Candidatus Aminicenantes bacterium]NIM82883.1 hypothetical protein [Candidatus Aminicenantes bacterium]NIN22259.1 hypothetical protein [Candidatus Aminicenantes bacterium]NIN46027.1 hypothetical protein [Candidatus Aminicenantes bacterium]NIN88863.1 hypothetical protein [Candidatus Aminicenantes bacterium]